MVDFKRATLKLKLKKILNVSFITDEEFNQYMLEALERRFDKCEECSLHKKRQCVVFGQGDSSADFFIVGEAPGEKEDDRGKPFVGPSGAILRRSLGIAGISIENCYITNTVLCRPPKNRKPTKAEREACRYRLIKQIDFVQPKILILIGSTAASLCGLRTIQDNRGEIDKDLWPQFESRSYFNLKHLFLTYHPSYILRQKTKGGKRMALNRFVTDLRKAKAACDE